MIDSEEGKPVMLGGLGRFTGSLAQSPEASFSTIEHPIQPVILGAPSHAHLNQDEYSFVSEAETGVLTSEKEFTATRAPILRSPECEAPRRNHAFCNAGWEPARILEIISLWRSSLLRASRPTSMNLAGLSRTQVVEGPTLPRLLRLLESVG